MGGTSGFLKGPWWEEALRALFVVPTGGLSEVIGRDNQMGRTFTGGAEGGIGGFLTGGPMGALRGAGTGAGLSGTGTTDPYSLKGGAINFGSGGGAGGLGHLGALFGGSGGASATSGLTPYMPTSPPNYPMAGSTLGPGGMFSSLNPMGASGTGSAFSSGAGLPSYLQTALKLMRSMPSGGGGQQQQPAQQRQNQEAQMRLIYQMFPNLRPGASLTQGGGSLWQS